MDDAAGMNVVVAIDDLVHDGDGFCFWDGSAAGDQFGQVSSIAKFCDDVGIVFGVIDVINFYDVIAVLEYFEDVDFRG